MGKPDHTENVKTVRLCWKIVCAPSKPHPGGGISTRYWAEAPCDCGTKLSATGLDLQGLEADKLRVESLHFLHSHDRELQRKLRTDIREGRIHPLDCQCCGFHGLKNPHVVEGHIVGIDCKKHPDKFPCRAKDRGLAHSQTPVDKIIHSYGRGSQFVNRFIEIGKEALS